MFEDIKNILKQIEGCPNVYVSQNTEYVIEPIGTGDAKDYVRHLKFTIVERGASYINNVIYKASVKENNPEMYLKSILEDLIKISKKYLKIAV